jgi:hypothetical protein
LPQFKGKSCDVFMSERDNSVRHRRSPRVVMGFLRMLKRLSGMLVSCQMILFSLQLPCAMSVRGDVVQFCGALVILVV